MAIGSCFKHFLENTVNLNQSRIDQLEQRVKAITTYLDEHPTLGTLIEGAAPQGSYAHKTIIRPVGNHEFDADLVLIMQEQHGWQPCDYIEQLYTAFRDSATYAKLAGRKGRCVTIDYANEFHLDVVPLVLRADGQAYIVNRTDNRFERTNPEGFNAWLDERNRVADGHLVEVIRLLKYLRDHKQTFSVKSVILTTLLGQVVNDARLLNDPAYYGSMASALYHVTQDLDDYLQANPVMPVIADPSCDGENFNHRWDDAQYANFRDRFHTYTAKIAEAYGEPDEATAIRLWQVVFGSEFKSPPPKLAPLDEEIAAAKTEQFLGRDHHVVMGPLPYRLKINARAIKKPGFRTFDLPKNGNRVTKNRRLRFTIVDCNVPGDYQVYWKIKNTGEEAFAAEALRGEIVRDNGTNTHEESTLYRGSHYVECYVVKDGKCVARDRQQVTVV
jgi:hypothetical protein